MIKTNSNNSDWPQKIAKNSKKNLKPCIILILSAILACFSKWPVHFLGHSRLTDFDLI